jgi:hypothetical protein
MPEPRAGGLPAIVQQAGEDQLLVRAELAEHSGGALGVPRIALLRHDEADGLLDALSHVSRRGT